MSNRRALDSRPDYTVRVSSRAKHVRLKVSHKRGLEVVVPEGFDATAIPSILSCKRDWIERSMRRLREQTEVRAALSPREHPEAIDLKALGETWRVTYRPSRGATRPTLHEVGARNLLINRPPRKVDDDALLRRWLQHKGREALVPWLERTSHELDLPYGRSMVRGQKTRWGSCSSQKTISLNYKLLFLPDELVRYLFVHELCHTRHLNHSSRFWRLVQSREPDYEHLERELTDAWRYVPLWVED
jgi:predicted metal-dependent hydrolase